MIGSLFYVLIHVLLYCPVILCVTTRKNAMTIKAFIRNVFVFFMVMSETYAEHKINGGIYTLVKMSYQVTEFNG